MRIQQQNPKRGDWKDILRAGNLRVTLTSDDIIIVESNGIDEKTGDVTTFRVSLSRNEIAYLSRNA